MKVRLSVAQNSERGSAAAEVAFTDDFGGKELCYSCKTGTLFWWEKIVSKEIASERRDVGR